MKNKINFTFPVNCGDDVKMCVMVEFCGDCVTMIVGVDWTTWTRLELLVSGFSKNRKIEN